MKMIIDIIIDNMMFLVQFLATYMNVPNDSENTNPARKLNIPNTVFDDIPNTGFR